jgi:hypothetical protein
MADDEEREGLLTNDESRGRRRKKNWLPVSTAAVSVDERQYVNEYNSEGGRELLGCNARNSLQTQSENDFIIAVFVVAFDTKSGEFLSR